jgi:hypothetical protein
MPLGDFLKILLGGLCVLAVLFIIGVEISVIQALDNIGKYESYEHAAKEHFESFQAFVISVIKWFGHRSAEELIALFTGILAVATIFLWFAAQRILTDSRRTNEMQLRAYVYPVSAIITEGKLLKPPRADRANFPGIALEWKNTGQTPAYNVVNWAAIEVIEPSNENRLIVPQLLQIHFTTLGASVSDTKSMWHHRGADQR